MCLKCGKLIHCDYANESKDKDFEAAQSEEITPEPWQLSVSASGWHISRNGYLIATVVKESDAKLIVAAIDLLAAGKEAKSRLAGFSAMQGMSKAAYNSVSCVIEQLVAAIDRATK